MKSAHISKVQLKQLFNWGKRFKIFDYEDFDYEDDKPNEALISQSERREIWNLIVSGIKYSPSVSQKQHNYYRRTFADRDNSITGDLRKNHRLW